MDVGASQVTSFREKGASEPDPPAGWIQIVPVPDSADRRVAERAYLEFYEERPLAIATTLHRPTANVHASYGSTGSLQRIPESRLDRIMLATHSDG